VPDSCRPADITGTSVGSASCGMEPKVASVGGKKTLSCVVLGYTNPDVVPLPITSPDIRHCSAVTEKDRKRSLISGIDEKPRYAHAAGNGSPSFFDAAMDGNAIERTRPIY